MTTERIILSSLYIIQRLDDRAVKTLASDIVALYEASIKARKDATKDVIRLIK